ncbi:class I SAM-dependent methyltransferase [Aureibacillus halotolerans]|uniref:Methyltransferase family protein n=1 Tax=Aureibacillus halotolerans TaxID=1508390 RepID=A0A4R6U8U4_9BACI|nr:class I SAM-dependent methyltransferase [Aureibacillus halotolerans]TDQ41065.1 methyltransferase family protein [Aureibacillus halotolerans]
MKTALHVVAKALEGQRIAYHFINETALYIQGALSSPPKQLSVEVQWDVFDAACQLFNSSPPETRKNERKASCSVEVEGTSVQISCLFQTTVRTHPQRIQLASDGERVWCLSLYAYLGDQTLAPIVQQHLNDLQNDVTQTNQHVWNRDQYTALVERHGAPNKMAQKLKKHPAWRLHPFKDHLEPINGSSILHLMGSSGVKGVALSMLGAKVTIVDFSEENAAYAKALAEEAGVHLDYIVTDVLRLPEEPHNHYDRVVLELGVLHYFVNLQPLMNVVAQMLANGGRFVLHEFHPVSTKLITSTGKMRTVDGNYFDPTINEQVPASSKHLPEDKRDKLPRVFQRKWTLGEIVTAVAKAGLTIDVLSEEPNHKMNDIGLPKTFTLVATKPA